MAHPDEKEDKKLFKSMMKKALGNSKISKTKKHLKHDIKESKKGISEDKKLMKTLKKKGSY